MQETEKIRRCSRHKMFKMSSVLFTTVLNICSFQIWGATLNLYLLTRHVVKCVWCPNVYASLVVGGWVFWFTATHFFNFFSSPQRWPQRRQTRSAILNRWADGNHSSPRVHHLGEGVMGWVGGWMGCSRRKHRSVSLICECLVASASQFISVQL